MAVGNALGDVARVHDRNPMEISDDLGHPLAITSVRPTARPEVRLRTDNKNAAGYLSVAACIRALRPVCPGAQHGVARRRGCIFFRCG
jgi:hypothetical protein